MYLDPETALRELSGRYTLHTRSLQLAGSDFLVTAPAQADALLDEFLDRAGVQEADAADERIPYWAELWPSALALSAYLLTQARLTVGATLLELGCGLGLPGIAAARMGAKVTLSDYLEEPLKMAAVNSFQNLGYCLPVCLLDWRKPDAAFAADCVIASDVAYERHNFEPLLKALSVLVKPGGFALISEPGRKLAEPFFGLVAQEGWQYSETPMQGTGYKATVYELRRAFI